MLCRLAVVGILSLNLSFAFAADGHDGPGEGKGGQADANHQVAPGKDLTDKEIKVLKASFPAWHEDGLKNRFGKSLSGALEKAISSKDEVDTAKELSDLFITRKNDEKGEYFKQLVGSGDDKGEIGKFMKETEEELGKKEANSSRELELERRIFWAGRWMLNENDPVLTKTPEAIAFIKEFKAKFEDKKKWASDMVAKMKQNADLLEKDPTNKGLQDFQKELFGKNGVNLRSAGAFIANTTGPVRDALLKLASKPKDGKLEIGFNTAQGPKTFSFANTPEGINKFVSDNKDKLANWTLISPTAEPVASTADGAAKTGEAGGAAPKGAGAPAGGNSANLAKTKEAITARCAGCHSKGKSGSESLTISDATFASKSDLSRMANAVEAKRMPKGMPLGATERTQLVNWLRSL